MTKAEPIHLFEGTRVVHFNAAHRGDMPDAVHDVTGAQPDALERAVAEVYPGAHARFVFKERGKTPALGIAVEVSR